MNSKYRYKACLLFMASIAARVTHYFVAQPYDWATQYILPIMACIAYIVGIYACRTLRLLGVTLGCVFFVIKALSFGTTQLVLCVLLYVILGTLYFLTYYRIIKNKRWLLGLLSAALATHLVWDIYDIIGKNYTIISFIPELSVLFIISALSFDVFYYNFDQIFVCQ